MGSGQFNVHPDSIDGAAPKFSQASADVAHALSTLKAAISGDAAAIGHDTPGQRFGSGYFPNKQKILEGIDQLIKGLQSVDPALRAMAANYSGADSTNSSMLGGGG